MKNITKTILLTAFVAMILPVGRADAITVSPTPIVISMQTSTDARVIALTRVFEKYNSPLAPFSQAYIDTADKYGIDWELLPAISGLESSFGNAQMPGSYNSYGWGGGHIYFKSVEDGIDVVLSGLKKNYIGRGATTVESIAPIYSESPTWAPRVRRFMNEIDTQYSRVKTHNLILTI